jgi:IS30 family transposase
LLDERRKIARWRAAGTSVDVIAEKLHRHRSTIFRELRRNTFEDAQMSDLNDYYCVMANGMARNGVPNCANLPGSRTCANR